MLISPPPTCAVLVCIFQSKDRLQQSVTHSFLSFSFCFVHFHQQLFPFLFLLPPTTNSGYLSAEQRGGKADNQPTNLTARSCCPQFRQQRQTQQTRNNALIMVFVKNTMSAEQMKACCKCATQCVLMHNDIHVYTNRSWNTVACYSHDSYPGENNLKLEPDSFFQ